MKTLELFCGTKSFSKVFEGAGHSTFTVDCMEKFQPDLCKDIMEVSVEELPKDIDIVWASPPCTTFSIASVFHHWDNGNPKNIDAVTGRAILYKTIWLIEKLKPKYWFIENPRGMMRKENLMVYLTSTGAIRRTISYCQYGDNRQKPTDIWNNCKEWIPKPMCNPKDNCHEYSPRGSKGGTQGLSKLQRSVIPAQIFEEILEAIK